MQPYEIRLSSGVGAGQPLQAPLRRLHRPHPVHRDRVVVVDPEDVLAARVGAELGGEPSGRRRALVRLDVGDPSLDRCRAPSRRRAREPSSAGALPSERARRRRSADTIAWRLSTIRNGRPRASRSATDPSGDALAPPRSPRRGVASATALRGPARSSGNARDDVAGTAEAAEQREAARSGRTGGDSSIGLVVPPRQQRRPGALERRSRT